MSEYNRVKSILDRHNKIAWDADETLINGPHSELFCRYVTEHPETEHHIVTFRHGSWAQKVLLEIEAYGLNKDQFAGLHHLPHDGFYWCNDAVENKSDQLEYYSEQWGWTVEQIKDNSNYFVIFKGLKAAEIGATILIDDKPHWVLKGCDENKIAFLDSITLEHRCSISRLISRLKTDAELL